MSFKSWSVSSYSVKSAGAGGQSVSSTGQSVSVKSGAGGQSVSSTGQSVSVKSGAGGQSLFQDVVSQRQVCVIAYLWSPGSGGTDCGREPDSVCQCQSVSAPSVSAPVSVSVRVSAVFTLSCVDAAAVSQCVQHADSQSSHCRVSMLPLCLSVFSMRTVSLHVVVCRCCRCVSVCSACGQSVFTLSCVDAAAVSQCVQHADSQSSHCRVSMLLPLCLSVFSMRTVSLHIVVCRCCRCVSVCSACGQSSRCRVSMLPLCLSVFSMRTVSLHIVVCRCCCRCVSVCSACGQSVFTLSCVDAAAAVSQCVQHADSQSSHCRVSMLPLCLSVFSMRTVFTLSCVDAAAVSQCVQHADSQSSRCRVSMLPLCLSVFSMRTVFTLSCVDAAAVSQCVQHADSLH